MVSCTTHQFLSVACAPSQLAKVAKSVLDKNVDDLVQMDDINEAMIVHNLRKRFKSDQIYVRVPFTGNRASFARLMSFYFKY